jgi:hypothetical protein
MKGKEFRISWMGGAFLMFRLIVSSYAQNYFGKQFEILVLIDNEDFQNLPCFYSVASML